MKKIIIALVVLFASFGYSQKRTSYDFRMGYSENKSITFDIGARNVFGKFGLYFGGRGFNITGDRYDSSVDYSSIADKTVILSTKKTNLGSWGMIFGTNYNFKNSGFTISLGAGFAEKMIENSTWYLYDFKYTKDEYNTKYYYETESLSSYEVLLDYDFIHKKQSPIGFGLLAGYNNVNGIIAQVQMSINLHNLQ